jgi:hypothetical protein
MSANLEVMWLLHRLPPDHKNIAESRMHSEAVTQVGTELVRSTPYLFDRKRALGCLLAAKRRRLINDAQLIAKHSNAAAGCRS